MPFLPRPAYTLHVANYKDPKLGSLKCFCSFDSYLRQIEDSGKYD